MPIQLDINSILIDFFLWDLAKKIETGEEVVDSSLTQTLFCLFIGCEVYGINNTLERQRWIAEIAGMRLYRRR